jgi:iron complex outermembrane receptor protein
MATQCFGWVNSASGILLVSLMGGISPSLSATELTSSSDSQNSLKLEEIIVTARRREENLQQVPIAITEISPQQLRDNNITTLLDIQQLVPSLTVTTGNVGQRDSANVSIRGQGWGSFGQPATAMYLNEVPIPTDYSNNLAGGPGLFFDLQNVQVLKGPQGTLFGKNTMGGAILLQSARPTDDFGGRISVGYGNYNDREVDGEINLPIIDNKLLARIAINGQWRDGFTNTSYMPGFPNGIDLDNRDQQSVRGTLTFNPIDAVHNDTILTYQQYTSHGSADFFSSYDPAGLIALVYGAVPVATLLAEQQALGARNHLPITADLNGQGGNLFALENLTDVKINDWLTYRDIFGFHQAVFNNKADLFGADLPIFNDLRDRYPSRQFTDEMQLLGNNGHFDWVAGAYWSQQGPPSYRDYPVLALEVLAPAGSPPVANDSVNRQLIVRSKAIFGQGTYDLSDWVPGLKVTGGVRNTWDSSTTSGEANGVVNAIPAASSAPTYTAVIEYQAAAATSIYFTSRRGYRSSGATEGTNGTLYPYQPEYVTDFEVGVKSDWRIADVAVRTNAAVYYQRYTDIQVNELIPTPGTPIGINITANAAKARLWGAEFESTAVLTKNFEVGANFSYLSFKYLEFGTGVDPTGLIAGETANRIPYQYGVNSRYLLPIPDSLGNASVAANWHWQDHFGDFLGTSQIPAYGLLTLSLDWKQIVGHPIDVQLFCSNALNKTYENGGIGFIGISEVTYGDPRLYGIRVAYRFGAQGK